MRLCARIALPAEPAVGTPADHGYTYGWHLTGSGAPAQDPIYLGDDGEPIYYARPKVCAYWDPSFWDSLANYATFLFGGAMLSAAGMMGAVESSGLAPMDVVQGFMDSVGDQTAADVGMDIANMLQANLQPDLWDLNPLHQAIHFHQGGVHFIFQLLIQLVKMGVGMANMMDSLVDSLPDGLKYIIMILSSMFWIMKAFTFIGPEVMVPVLEYLGQFNNVVTQALGCALVSIGPYPPPYCRDIFIPSPTPTMTPICRTTTASIEAGNGMNKCTSSPLVNNAIRNSVRVSFRDLKSICPAGEVPGDSCVSIHPTLNASSLHAMTSGSDVLNVCNGAISNLPCVESPTLLQKCAQDANWCSQGVRIVFGVRAGATDPVTMRDTYDTSLDPCQLADGACQMVWGVNVGNWHDYSLIFPSIENGHNIADLLSNTVTLKDTNGDNYNFKLMIPRAEREIDNVEVEPTRFYLMKDDLSIVLDSVPRAAAPRPTVYDCNSEGVNCTSHHLKPGIVAKIQVGADSTKGALSSETHLVPSPLGTLSNHRLNLAGKDFTSFVTESSYLQAPFEDANSINPSTRLGDYTNYVGDLTYDNNGMLNPAGAMYIGGLEYFQNKYVMGGEQVCLTGYQFNDCFTGNTKENCVLVNLTNDDQIRCTDFVNMVFTKYNGVGICNDQQASQYAIVETVQVPKPVSGNLSVTVKGDTPQGPYCYDWSGRVSLGKLCDKSQIVAERVTPVATIGAILPDGQYYNYNPASPPNANSLGVRNKNPVEHGMCVDVPDFPPCQPITGNGATWPVSNVAARATGVCGLGGIPKGPDSLLRYCTINRSTLQSVWEPVNANMGCMQNCGIVTNFNNASYNNATKLISLSTPGLGGGVYNYYFTMDIFDLSQLNNFRFVNGGADDYIKIIVNGTQVSSNGYSDSGSDRYANVASSPTNVNIIPHLVQGTNTINVTIRVVGGGSGYANFLFDMVGCNNLAISAP